MKIAIIGLANAGKTTIFNALTGQNLETTVYPTLNAEPHMGVVKVPDIRVDRLAEIYKPKKITYATVEYIDYLGLTKGDMDQNPGHPPSATTNTSPITSNAIAAARPSKAAWISTTISA